MTAQALVKGSASLSDDAPRFTVLERLDDCEAILTRNNVGRIAFALHDRVSLVPVHYVYEDGWIYGRTASGGKLRDLLRNRRVAFEVDEHTQLFDWRSVVVRGPLYLIDAGMSPAQRFTHAKAVGLIRKLVPAAFTSSDPIPFRDQLFRIRAVEISGRASEAGGGKRVQPRSEEHSVDIVEPEADAILRRQVGIALSKIAVARGSDIRIDVFDGLLVLSGTVEDTAERSEVEAAVLRVPAVQAVVQQLETRFPSHPQATPAEIVREALHELRLSPPVIDPGIKLVGEHGWLRLEGAARSRVSREEAVRRLRNIKGSRGVIDRLRVTGPASPKIATDESPEEEK